MGGALLARMLGPQMRGEFELLALAPSLFVLVFRSGIMTAVVYYSGLEPMRRDEIASSGIGATLVLGATGAITGLALSHFLPFAFFPVDRTLLAIACIMFPLLLLLSNMRELLNGRLDFGTAARSTILEKALFTTLLLLIWCHSATLQHSNSNAVANWQSDPLSAIYCFWIISFSSAAVYAFTRSRLRPSFSSVEYERLFSYGIKISPAALALFLHLRFDQFVLGSRGSLSELGYYAIAITVSEVFLIVPESISSALFPRLAVATSVEKCDLFQRAARVSTVIMLGGSGFLMLSAPTLINLLFGSAFSKAAILAAILIPARCFYGMSQILKTHLMTMGRPDLYSALSLSSLAINVVFVLMLVPLHGAKGAATAAIVSQGIEYLGALYLAKRITGGRLSDLLVARPSDATFLFKR